jgi:hypothetical protein
LLDEHGKRFSKRIQSAGLEPIRAGGVSPAHVVGQFASECGLVDRGEQLSAGELETRYKQNEDEIMHLILVGRH